MLIAEKFISNVQLTTQILPEEMGRLCSGVASEIITSQAIIDRTRKRRSDRSEGEAKMNRGFEK
jgi:hypothetical protein